MSVLLCFFDPSIIVFCVVNIIYDVSRETFLFPLEYFDSILEYKVKNNRFNFGVINNKYLNKFWFICI